MYGFSSSYSWSSLYSYGTDSNRAWFRRVCHLITVSHGRVCRLLHILDRSFNDILATIITVSVEWLLCMRLRSSGGSCVTSTVEGARRSPVAISEDPFEKLAAVLHSRSCLQYAHVPRFRESDDGGLDDVSSSSCFSYAFHENDVGYHSSW